MPAGDFDEVRIALGRADGGHVADEPKQEARDPEAQTDAQRSCERAVEDGDGAWRTAHQDRLGQRAMDWSFEAWDPSVHQLEAAKAIDRPNTIWINLRKPPDV